MQSNHYKTLSLERNASDSDIKKAYRSLSLKFHPDRNPSPTAKQTFQEINEAYETLSDARKRQEHDDILDGKISPDFIEINEDDLSNLFGMMFAGGIPMSGGIHVFQGGGGFPGMFAGGHPAAGLPGFFDPREHLFRQMQKPPAIIKNIEITLDDAYKGCTIPFPIDKWVIHKGQHEKTKAVEIISVVVHPGTETNEVIVINEMGNEAEGMKGDVKIILVILPHATFERRNLDLVYKKELTLKESLSGFSFEIKHLNGKLLTFNNDKSRTIVCPGYKKIIPGMGMVRNQFSGNLIVEFDVQFPESLSQEQMDALATLL